jgi:hypothetical protein
MDYLYAGSVVLVLELDLPLELLLQMIDIPLHSPFYWLHDLYFATAGAQPYLNECLLLVFVQANAYDFSVQLISHQTEDQIFPNIVHSLVFIALALILKLKQQSSTILPVFPHRAAAL